MSVIDPNTVQHFSAPPCRDRSETRWALAAGGQSNVHVLGSYPVRGSEVCAGRTGDFVKAARIALRALDRHPELGGRGAEILGAIEDCDDRGAGAESPRVRGEPLGG